MCSCCKCCSCKCDTLYPPPPSTPVDQITEKIDLSRWKLTLPDGKEVKVLKESVPPYFIISDEGILMKAKPIGTTPNSKYSRCELRELNVDKSLASWTVNDQRAMNFNFKAVQKPEKRPKMVVGQIHDTEDDVIMLVIDFQKRIYEVTHNSIHYGNIVDSFEMDTWYNVTISVKDGKIKVECGEKKLEITPSRTKGYYFKVGNYLQSTFKEDEGAIVVSKITLI